MKIRSWWRLIKLIKRLIFRDNPNMFNLWSAFEEIGKDIIAYETQGEKTMIKEQKIQELTERIENSQVEIDELKKELEKLQKKSYEISYPEDDTEMYYIDDYTGELEEKTFDIGIDYDKRLYEIGLLFDTKEEAEQFLKEQTLIKKIKCWAKEQQGDWEPDWRDTDEFKYYIKIYVKNEELWVDSSCTGNTFSKLPFFKSYEIAQACIDEFGDEILEVFC